jgi:hypothetical protein
MEEQYNGAFAVRFHHGMSCSEDVSRRSMHENKKGLCIAVGSCSIMIALMGFAAVQGAMEGKHNDLAAGSMLLVAGVAGTLISTVMFFKWQRYGDCAPDYLFQTCGVYLERDGFCFTITGSTEAGVYYLNVHFQNRYEQPFVGRVALRQVWGSPGASLNICPCGRLRRRSLFGNSVIHHLI